jgi:hypothetical protein
MNPNERKCYAASSTDLNHEYHKLVANPLSNICLHETREDKKAFNTVEIRITYSYQNKRILLCFGQLN